MVEGLSSSGGSISQAPNIYSDTTKNISDIFISVTASDGVTINPCIVLIEGAPGIGKTVLAKEIAFQWASNKLLIDRKILFLLFLRQCNFKSMVSVESFVQHLVKSSEMTVCLTKYLLQTEGKELAIVFDGYDEISNEDRYNSIVADIIDRKVFAKCCLVITSRPTASSALHNVTDCRVEIVGFTEEDRLDYIQNALEGNDDKVKALTIYLQSNPTINALCYIPLNMTILLCLVEDGIDRLPKTQTDMYKKFIEMSIIRFIQKVDLQISEVITNIARLPFPYNKVFEELTRLAYNALRIDKIVFKLNEIEELCPNLATASSNWNGLGLLKAVRHTDAELGNVTFHFLHFSIQEYMAALYISTLSNSEQIELLKKTFWQDRYYNTWIMYVGITCGCSFALKHFLSGNLFQFMTKIFKTSSISYKYLNDKIKCLHLFQCLMESNNEDMIALVSRFFQGDKIDLSNQTLLPSDVNTLGFFLIRCIYKQWELLDLSGCNIGTTGIKILCNGFSNQESRKLAIIKKVDFSYNHLNFSSLLEILNLLKSWRTSELIIKDSEILSSHTNSYMFKFINDVLFSSDNGYHSQVGLELGSILFGYKINVFPMLLNAELFIKDIYLLNCTLESTDLEESTLAELIANQTLSEIHLINTYFPNHIMSQLCLKLLDTDNPSLFVYNPGLPDQDADELGCSILSSNMTNRIMLIISKSKIQGIIDTFNICEQLTKLEIFNLAININHKYSNNMKTSPWKQSLYYDNSNDDLIKDTFIDMFFKINCSEWNWQLRIILKEKDVLIAHKVDYKCISEKIKSCVLKGIYLNDCDIKNKDYRVLLDAKETVTCLYILYSYTNQNFLMILHQNLSLCKEMFVHTSCSFNIEEIGYLRKDCSTVLVANNQLFACNPTTKQIALALQLEPSINILRLQHCQENFDRFKQIATMLTTMQKDWVVLDFMNCDLKNIEYEFLQNCLRKNMSTIKWLKVSSNQLTKLLVPKFIESILIWKVQHLLFSGISHTVYKCFVSRFIASTKLEKVFLPVMCDNMRDLFFCNYSWSQINSMLRHQSGDTLYSVNCHFPSQAENLNITELSHISKLHIINSTVHEDTIVNILETFIERKLKVSIYYYTCMHVGDTSLYNFITRKKLLYQSRLSFVAVMKNLMCGFNATDDQLQFLLSQKLNDLDCAVVTLQLNDAKKICEERLFVTTTKHSICGHNSVENQLEYLQSQNLSDLEWTIITLLSDTKEMHSRCIWLFVFQKKKLTALHYVREVSEPNRITKLATVLKRIPTLQSLEIDKYFITDKLTNNIVTALSHNKGLEQLYFNSKLETVDLLNILEMISEKLTNLKVFEISNNSITDQETKFLTSIISHNAQLQYFNITNGNLSTTNAIKISKATSNLQELTISGNNTGVNVLTAIAPKNSLIKELHLGDSNVQMICIKLAKNLQPKPIFQIRNSKSIEDIAEGVGASLGKSELQKCDISEYKFHTKNIIAITEALQSIYILKKLCVTNNNVTTEIVDDIVNIICNNTLLEELNVSHNNLQSTDAVKIAKAVQNISTLTKLYFNNNHITDKAADDIIAALSCNTQLQELDISSNWFQVTGIMKIAKALKDFATLKKLCIGSNNLTKEAADHIAEVIRMNTQLQEFDVSKIGLQSTSAIKIAKVLRNVSTLTKLYINSNDITVDAADDIANALSCNYNCLQELDISNNCFCSIGIIKIAIGLNHISTLKKLYMSGNYITDKAADEINAIIIHNTGLQEFDISENNLQAKGIMKIAKTLQNISTLKKLNISKNNITEEAADDIARVVNHNAQLQQLNMGFNRFASNGIARIAVALCKTIDLRALQIENNEICDKAVYSIAQAISCNTKLEIFNCSDNHFSMGYIIKIVKVLGNISTLTKLCISNSNITDKAVDVLAAVLCKNTKLQEVDVSDNILQSQGAIKIAKALQNISTLTKLYANNIFSKKIVNTAVDDLASALYCNIQLEELDISNNQFPAACIVKIANSLQNISTLKKLYMNNNNINAEAADCVAIALSCSSQLEVFDISGNILETEGFIKIAKALQKISTLQQLYIHNNSITDEASNDIVIICYHNTQLKVLYFQQNLFSFPQALGLYTECDKLLLSLNKIIRYI